MQAWQVQIRAIVFRWLSRPMGLLLYEHHVKYSGDCQERWGSCQVLVFLLVCQYKFFIAIYSATTWARCLKFEYPVCFGMPYIGIHFFQWIRCQLPVYMGVCPFQIFTAIFSTTTYSRCLKFEHPIFCMSYTYFYSHERVLVYSYHSGFLVCW